MKTLTFSLILLASLLVSSLAVESARADQVGGEGREWVQNLLAAVKSGQAVFTVVDPSANLLPTTVQAQIAEIADDQFQIWGDTILEGDYVAENNLNIDQIQLVHVGSAFVGYRVTYSAVAYETGHCDPRKASTVCPRGHIREASYIAPDFNAWTRDTEALAEFQPE